MRGVKIYHFQMALVIDLYNNLYYHASRDNPCRPVRLICVHGYVIHVLKWECEQKTLNDMNAVLCTETCALLIIWFAIIVVIIIICYKYNVY